MFSLRNKQKATQLFQLLLLVELLLIAFVCFKGDFTRFSHDWIWLAALAVLLSVCYVLYLKLKTEWMEQNLQDEKYKFQSLVGSLDVGIIIIDEAGTITTMNEEAAAILHLDPSTALTTRLSDHLPENIRHYIDAGFTGCIPYQHAIFIECIAIQSGIGPRNGRMLLWKRQAGMQASSGGLSGRDILARLHDAAIQTVIKISSQEGVRMDRLCFHFWKLAGWTRNAIYLYDTTPVPEPDGPHRLDAILTSALKKIEPARKALRITLTNHIHYPNPVVQTNFMEMEWVMMEIILNAMASLLDCDAPRIDVTLDAEEESFLLNFLDNGCAIHKTALARMDENMLQRSDGDAGLGLGLHAARKIIEASDGNIWIESTTGKGTRVSILLPKHQDVFTSSHSESR